MDFFLPFAFGFGAGLAVCWFLMPTEEDEHWPDELDEDDPTLDIQNHWGDSRPVR